MSSTRKGLDGFVVATMVLLCAIWGAQQVAIKLAAHDVVPIMQVGLRSGMSAALVLLLVRIRGEKLSLRDGTLRPGLLAGVLFAAEFLFVAEGLRRTSASHMAVLLYTSPIFTAVGLHWTVRGERLRPRQWLGIALAFAGVVVAFAGGWLHGGLTTRMLVGDALGVLAGAAWGVTTVVVRGSALSDAAPAKTLLYQLTVASVLLLGAAAVSGQAGQVSLTPVACASLLFQGVVVSFASYLAWFWLLRRYAASQVSVFSFLTPLFGVTFGVLVLGERVDVAFGIGAALVLAGITVVSAPGLRRRETRSGSSVGPREELTEG
jgi:drug/metabolite transporter (DMT)-like permease